jgi:DNA repair protein SbcC/Rad50
MITALRVRNYQSLRELDLKFGQLTVITGPSNSGKSAVLRAIKAVVTNVPSPSVVTAGQPFLAIALTVDDYVALLERGEGKSTYHLQHAAWSAPQVFTKAGRSVPTEVSRAIKLPADGGPHFTFQFDKPFLLDAPAPEVTRALSALTNADMVLAAAKEANRRKTTKSAELKVRQRDKLAAEERLQEFEGLEGESQLLDLAESLLDSSDAKRAAASTLRTVVERLEVAATARTELLSSLAASTTPNLDQLTLLVERSTTLSAKILKIESLVAQRQAASQLLDDARTEEGQAQEARRALLEELGHCPTCGSPTT